MKSYILTTVMALAAAASWAQGDMQSVLNDIEDNNTTLKALRDNMEAQKVMNITETALDDPEIELAYLWGSPNSVLNRKDISVRQTFDIPTILGMRSNVAKSKNRLVELEYRQQRINIMLESKKQLIELIYRNAVRTRLNSLKRLSEQLVEAERKRMERGEANIIDSKKVEMNLAAVNEKCRRNDIERQTIMQDIKRLNGGNVVSFDAEIYSADSLASSFEQWYAGAELRNPLLRYVEQEIVLSKDNVKLSKGKNLPAITAGYTSELVPGSNYRGVSLGFSVPLWSNRKRVAQAQAEVKAAESRLVDAKLKTYSQLHELYVRAQALRTTTLEYKNRLSQIGMEEPLKKAYEGGALTLRDYILETNAAYDYYIDVLTAERDYQLALADLQAVEL